MNAPSILERFGLTPEVILRHAIPPPPAPIQPPKRTLYMQKYARKLRQKRLASGLTTAGRVRQHRARLTPVERLEARLAYDHRRMMGFVKQGLTTMGRPRQLPSKHCPNFKKSC